MNEVIARNFIELFKNSLFGMAGGCNGQCSIENVRVECGNQTEARRRREAADGKQTSKISLAVYFALKTQVPSNASLLGLNQTSQQISNNLLEALKKTDLNLNISGVVIQYDSSKPPVFRLTSLVCNKGQVQRGTRCGKEFFFFLVFVFIFGFKYSFLKSGENSNLPKEYYFNKVLVTLRAKWYIIS